MQHSLISSPDLLVNSSILTNYIRNILLKKIKLAKPSEIISDLLLVILSPYTVCHLRGKHSPELAFDVPSMIYAVQPWNVTLDTILLTLVEQGCSTFIVDNELAVEFLNNFILVHDKALYCNTRKAVVFTDVDHELLGQIQRHPAIREILDVKATVVRNNTLMEILSVNSMNSAAREFHTDFVSHLNGEILRVTSFEVNPMVKLIADRHGNVRYNNEWYIMDGLDGYIVTGFCKRYNCTWELTLIDSAIQFGQLYWNGSGDGMIGALFERRVDVGIAGVSVRHNMFPYFSFSATLQRVGIHCLTPRSKMLPSWVTLIRAFSNSVWFVLVICLICYSCILNFVLEKREPLKAIQQVLAAFLLQATNFQRRSLSETLFSVTILLTTIYFAFVYQGKIASMRNFPLMSSAVETIDQLAESRLHWNAPHEAWKYSLLKSDNPSILTLRKTFKALPAKDLIAKANEGKENFAFVRLHFGHCMFNDWINEENVLLYQLMSEDIYWEYETAWTTKTWPFLEPFIQHILQSWEAGLPQYEELITVSKYMNYKLQINIQHSKDRPQQEPKTLTVHDVLGIFVLLLLGVCLSGVVFAGEMVYFRMNTN